MKNRIFSLLIFFLIFCLAGYSQTPVLESSTQATQQILQQAKPVTPALKPVNPTTNLINQQKQLINFESCVRAYQTSPDNLFLLALAAINASGYKIDEMQSRTGLISFEAENKFFLISVTELDENSSMLKITPMNNSYFFSPTIIENIFLYLSNNVKG